jgi:cyclic dehypoxanthinyl futalosine synthase
LAAAGFEAVCEDVCEQVRATLDLGGTAVTLVPGSERKNAEYLAGEGTLRLYERLLAEIKRRHPAIWMSGLSAPEVMGIAASSGLGLRESLRRLRGAGLDSITGEGADVAGPEPWIEVHREAHGVGMRTTAVVMFGGTETPVTPEQRVDFLEAVRWLQEETGGFAAVAPLPSSAPGGRELEQATAVESLKTLAIVRMMLDNIENVQSSWTTQGLKVRQMGLRFGGNDVGAVLVGDGANGSSEEDLRRVIRDAGFRPVQRSMSYTTMFLD